MILVVDTDLKEVRFWVFKDDGSAKTPYYFAKDIEEVKRSRDLRKDVSGIAGKERVSAISFRILFGGDYFQKPALLDKGFFPRFSSLTGYFPFYIPSVLNMLKIFYRDFKGIPQRAFFETSFFSKLPPEEKYYAIPRQLQDDNRIRKWGFHGLFHEASSLLLPSARTVSVVIDKQTTVCSARSGNPLSISLGFTPLEGVMSRTSCGDLDPGVVFYLINNQGFSIYKIDDILKNESGFLGLTGYDLELKELVKFYGKDRKVTLAFDIYQAHLLKYIGEGISAMGGVDNIVFSGNELEPFVPVVFRLLKRISFLGISLKSLPWSAKEDVFSIASTDSKVKAVLNRTSLPNLICRATRQMSPR